MYYVYACICSELPDGVAGGEGLADELLRGRREGLTDEIGTPKSRPEPQIASLENGRLTHLC